MILNIDADNKRISLGLKQAQEDPWLKIGETYPVGTELEGTVVRLMDKGVVVDIGNDIEGFVPVSQLNFGEPVNSPADIDVGRDEGRRSRSRGRSDPAPHRAGGDEHSGRAGASGDAEQGHSDGDGRLQHVGSDSGACNRNVKVGPLSSVYPYRCMTI